MIGCTSNCLTFNKWKQIIATEWLFSFKKKGYFERICWPLPFQVLRVLEIIKIKLHYYTPAKYFSVIKWNLFPYYKAAVELNSSKEVDILLFKYLFLETGDIYGDLANYVNQNYVLWGSVLIQSSPWNLLIPAKANLQDLTTLLITTHWLVSNICITYLSPL